MSERAARGGALLYVIALPCAWWQGRSQDIVQVSLWVLGTFVLLAVTPIRRTWRHPAAGWLLGGALLSGVIHAEPFQLPLLALYGLCAVVGIWCLAQHESEFLQRCLVWLAWLNIGYWVSQRLGYDPLFDTDAVKQIGGLPGGFFSRSNHLALLLMVVYPFAPWPLRLASWPMVGVLGNLTAPAGMWLTHVKEVPGRWRGWLGGVGLAALAMGAVRMPFKVASRVEVWGQVVGQALWSPFYGYGLGAFEAQSTFDHGPWIYNTYLAAFHIGGVLLLAPLLYALWGLWKLPDSPVRTSLGLLALAALTQTPWHFPRFVVVTLALLAACDWRTLDANRV